MEYFFWRSDSYYLRGKLTEAIDEILTAQEVYPGRLEPVPYLAAYGVILKHQEAKNYAGEIDWYKVIGVRKSSPLAVIRQKLAELKMTFDPRHHQKRIHYFTALKKASEIVLLAEDLLLDPRKRTPYNARAKYAKAKARGSKPYSRPLKRSKRESFLQYGDTGSLHSAASSNSSYAIAGPSAVVGGLRREDNTVAYEEAHTAKLEPKLFLKDAISELPAIENTEERDEMPYTKKPVSTFERYIRLGEDGANFRDLPGVCVGDKNKVEFDPNNKRVYLPSGKPLVPDYAMSFMNGTSSKCFERLWWDETVPTVVTRADPHNQVHASWKCGCSPGFLSFRILVRFGIKKWRCKLNRRTRIRTPIRISE